MYRPAAFAETDPETINGLIDAAGPAHLVVDGPEGLQAAFIPMRRRSGDDVVSLVGHVARANPLWRLGEGCRALAILTVSDAYVSPSWYPSKATDGRVVPTWNYELVHAHGTLAVHEDPAWLAEVVRDLTDHHEAGRAEPWSVDDAPTDWTERKLRAIVGVELRVDRLDVSRKLSQNRSETDRAGVIAGLAGGSERERAMADTMSGSTGDH